MTLSDISIKNPVFAWMLMFGLILFGVVCFLRLGVSQMPDVDFPVVNVSITLPNASPQIMESDVADPVEDAVLGVEGVQDVQTTCTEGSVNISISLDISRNVDVAVQDVQTAVFQVEKHLPSNIYPPIIRKFNNNSSPIMWLAVSADPPLSLKDLMLYVRDHLKDRFTNLDGVANVFLGGFVDRQVNIWTDINKLNALQLTADDIVNTIQQQHAEVPAGFMETPQTQYDIRSMGEAYSIQDFGNLPILTRGGAPNYVLTKLKNVADIEDGLATITRISRFNGFPSCGMGIVMQDGYNAVDVGNAVKARMAEVIKQLPAGYHIALNFDTTTFIKDNVFELELTILLAALLTALVCYLFLGSWSSTLNVFLAIPTSLFGTFIIIYFCGFTLNTFTLLALSLSIGVVVDDAIMVLENIVRHQEKGEGMVEAALVGAREVTFAAVATSIAIVAIFLPLVFMQGVIGKFMLQFGVTLSGAVMISLLEAVTLTPMRCSQFVHAADETKGFAGYVAGKFHHLSSLYSKTLGWCLDYRTSDALADVKSKDFPAPKLASYLFFFFLVALAVPTVGLLGFGLFKVVSWIPWTWLGLLLKLGIGLGLVISMFMNLRSIRFFFARLFWIRSAQIVSDIQAEIKDPSYALTPVICFLLEVFLLILYAIISKMYPDYRSVAPGLAVALFPLIWLTQFLASKRPSLAVWGHWLMAFLFSSPLFLYSLVSTPSKILVLLTVGSMVFIFLTHWFAYLLYNRRFFFTHGFYDHKWWVLLAAIVFFASSMFMTKFVKQEIVPSTDQSVFLINYQLPVDYSIFHTDDVIKKCEALLRERKEIQNLYVAVGGFGGNAANTAIMFITMKTQGERPVADWSEKIPSTGPLSFITNFWSRHFTKPRLTQQEFMAVCRKTLSNISPDLQVFLIDLSKRGLSTGRGYDVEFTVTGPDWDKLAQYSEEIKKRLKADPMLADVNDNYLAGQPEIQIIPDRAKAALRGVNIADLGSVLGTLIGGHTFQSAYYHESGHQNNIFIRVPQDERLKPDDLRKVYTRNNRGEVVPILDVASMNQVNSLQQITRDNRQRAIYFQANHSPTATGQQALDEALKIAKEVLPDGYQTALTGTSQAGAQTGVQLLIAIFLGIAVAYMVLASQFNSFIHPVVILLALPFSITGAFGTLWLFNQSLNMYSMIGLFLLLGLVKKNSIMLVDFTNQARAKGMKLHAALLHACPIRLRPILMTSFATVAGAIPAALALGPGAELRQPMAVAIIGGLIISTLLTLLVVPCAYGIMFGWEREGTHFFDVDKHGHVISTEKN